MDTFLLRDLTDKQLLSYFEEKIVALRVSNPSDPHLRSDAEWQVNVARGEIMSRMRERHIQHGAMD